MEILAVIIFVVIVFTIAFIAYAYHWLSKKQSGYSPFFAPIPVHTIRTYNMEELAYSFIYSTPSVMMQQWNVKLDNPEAKILTKDALDYEKKRCAEKIGREMLKNGFIEVRERPHKHNPYMNEVNLLARVYRDGAVTEKNVW